MTNDLWVIYSQLVNVKNPGKEVNDSCIKYLKRIAKWLTTSNSKDSLLIVGSVGNGKTTLLKSVKIYIDNLHKCDYWVTFQTAKELYKNFDIAPTNPYKHPLYIIDDLGAEPTERIDFGNTVTPMIDIICYRYNRDLPFIATTNIDFYEIENKYDLRIKDRLIEMCDILFIEEDSYRK